MKTNNEVIIRELLRDEYDAISSYEEAILNVTDSDVARVLEDIKNEELVHVGELKEVLERIGVNDDAQTEQGREEAAGVLMESLQKLKSIIDKF